MYKQNTFKHFKHFSTIYRSTYVSHAVDQCSWICEIAILFFLEGFQTTKQCKLRPRHVHYVWPITQNKNHQQRTHYKNVLSTQQCKPIKTHSTSSKTIVLVGGSATNADTLQRCLANCMQDSYRGNVQLTSAVYSLLFILFISTRWSRVWFPAAKALRPSLTRAIPQHFRDESLIIYSAVQIYGYFTLYLSDTTSSFWATITSNSLPYTGPLSCL